MSTLFKIEKKEPVSATTIRAYTKSRDKLKFLAKHNGVKMVYLLEQVLDHLLKISGLVEEFEEWKKEKK